MKKLKILRFFKGNRITNKIQRNLKIKRRRKWKIEIINCWIKILKRISWIKVKSIITFKTLITKHKILKKYEAWSIRISNLRWYF